MRRKGKHHHEEHEEHVNHEAWVIPYADMLTLLMGLFLVLWAISTQDLKKLQEFGASFSGAVGINVVASGGDGVLDGSSSPTTTVPVGPQLEAAAQAALEREQQAEAARAAEDAELTAVESAIRASAESQGIGHALSFRREERGLVVSILTDDVLFDSGSALLRRDGIAVLDALAPTLRILPNHLSVEGHTDDRPIATSTYPSNWELSTARAATVLRYLVDRQGFAPDRISASGYADRRPVASNETNEGRAQNRRVDLAVLTNEQTHSPQETPHG